MSVAPNANQLTEEQFNQLVSEGYRLLHLGESLQEGDEVYVGDDQWVPTELAGRVLCDPHTFPRPYRRKVAVPHAGTLAEEKRLLGVISRLQRFSAAISRSRLSMNSCDRRRPTPMSCATGSTKCAACATGTCDMKTRLTADQRRIRRLFTRRDGLEAWLRIHHQSFELRLILLPDESVKDHVRYVNWLRDQLAVALDRLVTTEIEERAKRRRKPARK